MRVKKPSELCEEDIKSLRKMLKIGKEREKTEKNPPYICPICKAELTEYYCPHCDI